MRARFNPKHSDGPGNVVGFEAIARRLESLLNHRDAPVCPPHDRLIDLMWQRFCEKKRDFYCWDEMTKASEMKFLAESSLQPGPIMELCCGFSYWVREAMEQIDVGVDLFPDEGSYARSLDTLADDHDFADQTYKMLLQADVTQPLPAPDAAIANIISFCAFEHIPVAAYPSLFQGIKRMLSPGGRFVFSVQTYLCFQTMEQNLEPDLVAKIRKDASITELFDANYWDALLKNHGFRIIRRQGAIDRQRSVMFAMSFAPERFSHPLTTQFSHWLRLAGGQDSRWYGSAMAWLTQAVPPEDADLLLYEVTL